MRSWRSTDVRMDGVVGGRQVPLDRSSEQMGLHGSVITEARILFVPRGPTQVHRRAAPPTALGVAYLLVLFTLWLLNMADLVLTIHWTNNVGWAAEGNQILRHVVHWLGPVGFMVYKVLLMTFVVLTLWWLYLRFEQEAAAARTAWKMRALAVMRAVALGLTAVLIGFYAWVVWNNLHIVGYI